MPISIDRSRWSKSSQRSYASHYDERAQHYEGLAYQCRKCAAACVFTAETQKLAYETQKRYAYWIPSFCLNCQAELATLKAEDRELQAQWNESRDSLQTDHEFLLRWLFITKALISYRKGNPGMVNMLARRIAEWSADNPSG